MATEKRARSRSRENGGGSGRARSRSRSPIRRHDDRRRAKRRHRRPRDHRHSQRHSESHSHSHSRSRGKKKSRSPSSTRRYRSRSRSSSNSRRTTSRSTSHRRRDVSSSEERRPRAKGREEQQQRWSRDLDEREREREHEREPERESVVALEKVHASVTPEKARESAMPEKEREKSAAEERKEKPDPVEIREGKEQVRVRNVGDANVSKETANAKERAEMDAQEEPENEDKKQKDKEASFRFEHLEAIRNVQLITRNEYPLSHLKRENLLNRDYDDNDDEDDNDAVCYCSYPDTFDKDKKRCDDVSCLNFATYVECNSNCPAREYCGNQRLQHQHLFPKLEAFKTEHKGFGVRTTEEIAQSRIIGEYVGEIIDQKELNLRLKSAPRNELNFYYLLLEPGIYIDARNKGSFTRFVNHSCEPNCKTEKWTVKGETRIAVIALRDINKGEELTFDYQWKSLGSRQIKCFCESANCKGIIGTEGDVVKDDTPRGYFREPTKNETGAAIVNRRIRIFKSPDDHSMYYIATVRSYDEKDGLYEVDYQDTIDVADEEDVFDSPDDKSSERYIRLSELDWHIFFELDGLSEDQIEKEVFSIPKRRVTDQQQGESREPSPKQNENGVKSSRSSRESSPSNAMFTGRTISNAIPATKRNNDGEIVDEDGNVITNKILVKGVSNKCSAASLRTLFLVDDRRHRSGASDGAAARRNSQDVVNDLELFFFNDDSGWALVEFSDSKYASMFQRKLNNRPLYGKSLRIYHAGKKEVENFYRAKRNVAVRRRQDQAKSSTVAGAKDSTERQSGDNQKTAINDAPKVILPYCFGRKLNWQVSVEQMEDSPSRRIGISPSLEQKMREKCAKLIFRLVKKLHLDREDATSAIIALNRYLTFHAMDVSKVEHLAASLLHMFLKAHSRRFSWESFVSEVYAAKNSASSSNDPTKQLHTKSDEFLVTERPLLAVEKELLEGLRYDLSSEDPYALLDSLTSGSKGRKKPQQHGDSKNSLVFPSDVQKEAKHLVAEALRLPIWVQTPVECIVLSIVYVSAAVTQALKERASNSSENSAADASSSLPDFLPVLDGKKNELESLMLLECSLLICDNLKERWNRLEKIAKPSRKVDRSEDYFDTEQFAVAKEKPVEIALRISTLLKSWISVPSSSSGRASISPDRDASSGQRDDKTDFITLSMIGKSLAATAISSGSNMKSASESKRSTQGRDDDESEIVSAAAVVPKKVAKGPKGGSTSVLSSSDRLHTTEITDAEMIRKRCYLGAISKDVPFDLAEKKVYLQAWPNRDSESPFSKKGDISKSCVRELSAAIILHNKSPSNFIKLHGIVFPEEKKIKRSSISSASESESKGAATTVDLDAEMMDFSDTSVFSSSTSTRLETSKHYLAFEQPLHMYSGIFEAKAVVPTNLKKKAIFDMLQSLAVCHESNFVHRFVAPSHLYLFKSGAKLGGYHAMRKTTPGSSSSSNVYEMSENERKELCLGSWLSVTAPELLLGDRSFSWRSDIWSAGCVALSVLLDNIAFLQGMDTRMQLDLIFRLCGTPHAVWQGATKLPLFGRYKPKDEYKMRLRKTVTEHLQKQKREGLPDEAYNLLESMLHMDPAKRLSAKKLLEMDFFADIRSSSDAFDFSKIPETYSMQKKKLLAHLKSSKPKRRRPASGSGDFSSSALTSSSSHRSSSYYQRKPSEGGDSNNGKRESASRSKQNSTTTSGDRTVEMAEDVPLPAFFNASSSDATAKSESSLPARPEKRAKLGWGMGLHSTEKAE